MNGESGDRRGAYKNTENNWSTAFNLLSSNLQAIYNGFSNNDKKNSRVQILYYYRDRADLIFNTMGVEVPGMADHNASWANQMYEADISGSGLLALSRKMTSLATRSSWAGTRGRNTQPSLCSPTQRCRLQTSGGNVYVYAKWDPIDYMAEYYLSTSDASPLLFSGRGRK